MVQTADEVRKAVPFLRRYARALLCSQSEGDRLAADALELIVRDPQRMTDDTPRIALFLALHDILRSAPGITPPPGLSADARQALLLCGMEQFTPEQAARIMSISPVRVEALVARARDEVRTAPPGRVLVIEDELPIALDLETILSGMGHATAGNARTHMDALTLIAQETPDLILADIQLADDSSGLDAVNDILDRHRDIPIVFITGFPERLLTGKRPEPSFLVAKPYSPEQIEATVSQAMLFARRTASA